MSQYGHGLVQNSAEALHAPSGASRGTESAKTPEAK